jgi:hypothetical protein
MDINELDVVTLVTDLPEHGLETGDIGTVVNVFDDDLEKSYEVEFTDDDGMTIAMPTLLPNQFRRWES